MKEEEESDQDKLDLEATEILREEQGTHRILTDLFIALVFTFFVQVRWDFSLSKWLNFH